MAHKNLSEELEQVRDKHAESLHQETIAQIGEDTKQRALLLLGGVRAVNRVAENLSSQSIAALIEFQKEGLHEAFGFARFADFLDQSELSPMRKSEFYRRKELFEAEGGMLFDAFNASRIPSQTRKLLLKNNVAVTVDGDELVIEDQRVPVSDAAAVKDLVQTFHETLRDRDATEAKLKKKVDDQAEKIRVGTEELKDLQKTVDALQDDTPFARALMKAVGSLSDLSQQVRELPEKERLTRGEDDLKTVASLFFRLRESYGVSIPLAQPISVAAGATFDDKVTAELAKSDLSEVENA